MPRAFCLLMLAALPVAAEISDRSDAGFTVKHVVTVTAAPDKAYAALVDIGHWWDPAHTYSGDAKNLTLDLKPGGCWCEKVGTGGTEHMRVLFVAPNQMLRLAGGLGPLQDSGASGTLTLALRKLPEGTELTLTYRVGGYVAGGLAGVAAPVDMVLGEQTARLKKFIETGQPN